MTDDSDIQSAITLMDTFDDNGLNKALNMLQPARLAAFELSNMDDHHGVFALFNTKLLQNRPCFTESFEKQSHNIWVAPMTTLSKVGRQQDILGYKGLTGGLVAGYENAINKNFIAGTSLGYLYSNIKWPQKGGQSDLQKGFVAGYAGYLIPRVTLEASALGGISDYNVRRGIVFSGLERTARHHHAGGFFSSHLGLDVIPWINANWLHLFFQVDYNYLRQNGYRERGAGCLGLILEHRNSHLIRDELGLHFHKRYATKSVCWQIDYYLSWGNKTPMNKGRYRSKLYSFGNGPELVVDTINRSLNFFSPGVKVSCQKKGFSLATTYKGEFKGRYKTHQITFEISLAW